MKPSVAMFLGALLVALGPWGFENIRVWADLFQPGNVFSLLGILGGVTLSWLGKSPMPSKQ